MPICPFCRKPVETGSVWCSCGTNLGRYPKLPISSKEIKDWLAAYEPETIKASQLAGSLLDSAKKRLISEQEEEIAANTKIRAEVAAARNLIDSFLLDCRREGLAPTIDIGQLRRDRWRQWKRIPTEYRQHAPLKDFKLTPGYFFETSVARFKDEYCVAVDGTLYKHQLNSPDPFPIEDLLAGMPINNLAEALTAALLWLLKAKQQPGPAQERSEEPAGAAEAAKPRRGLRLPFARGKSQADSPETVAMNQEPETENRPSPGAAESEPAGVLETAGRPATPADDTVDTPGLSAPPKNGNRQPADLRLEKTTS